MGNYWVVAINNYGSTTSRVASLILTNSVGPTNLVYAPNEVGLLAAISLGGWVGLQFNGTLTLTNPISITNDVVLDGSRFGATLSGGNTAQLFYVATGASLILSNLTLANGLVTNERSGGRWRDIQQRRHGGAGRLRVVEQRGAVIGRRRFGSWRGHI